MAILLFFSHRRPEHAYLVLSVPADPPIGELFAFYRCRRSPEAYILASVNSPEEEASALVLIPVLFLRQGAPHPSKGHPSTRAAGGAKPGATNFIATVEAVHQSPDPPQGFSTQGLLAMYLFSHTYSALYVKQASSPNMQFYHSLIPGKFP